MTQYKKSNKPYSGGITTTLPLWRGVTLVLCVFVLTLIVGGVCAGIARGWFPENSRDGFLASSVTQNIVTFFGAALLSSFFLSHKPFYFLGLRTGTRPMTLFNIVVCFALGLPFLNEIVWLNSQMHFPDAFAGIENWMRSLEDTAGKQVDVLLGVKSVGGLLVNILIVGVLTGFCEEIFFRGTLQRCLYASGAGKHVAIWAAAFIFSLLHFQFFGFVPRLLLGAFFGYLFVWTGSIYACAFAHALFNSITVVTVWLMNRGVKADIVEDFGVQESGFPWIACISLALLLVYIIVLKRNRRF